MAGGLSVVPSLTAAAGILRPLYRRALSRALHGSDGLYTTDGVASGGEALRQIVCSNLIDDEEQADRLKGRYLYVVDGDDAGRQTRVLSTGYHGPDGYLEVSRPMTTPLASGIEIEITSLLPCDKYLDIDGLNQIVNEALAACDIEYRQTLTGDGTRSLSLLDYEAFIDRSDRADVVYDALGLPLPTPLDPSGYTSRVDATGAARTLVTDAVYTSADSVELRVIRAGHTLIKSGGAWGNSSVGLTSDAQAAAVPIPWVVAAGMCKALARPGLEERASGPNGLAYWRAVFARISREQFPQPSPKRRASSRPVPIATLSNPWSMP